MRAQLRVLPACVVCGSRCDTVPLIQLPSGAVRHEGCVEHVEVWPSRHHSYLYRIPLGHGGYIVRRHREHGHGGSIVRRHREQP